MTFNTEELPRTPCSKGFGSTKAVQKFWILRKRLETQVQEMAPQVGLEPTTLRLTAGCSAIELLRSMGVFVVVIHHIIGGGWGKLVSYPVTTLPTCGGVGVLSFTLLL